MTGGNAHQRAMQRAKDQKLAERVADFVVEKISGKPITPEQKSTWNKLLDFVEHGWFIGAITTVGALVGFFLYAPILGLCVFGILLAFIRSGIVDGYRVGAQAAAYIAVLAITTLGMYAAYRAIKSHLSLVTTVTAPAPVAQNKPIPPTPTGSDIKVSTVVIGTDVDSSERMVVQETKNTPAGSKWVANIDYSNEGSLTVDLHIYSTSSFITVDMANLEARTTAENMEWDRTINVAHYPEGMRTRQTPPHQALLVSPMLSYQVGADDLKKIVDYKAAVYFMTRLSYTVDSQEFNSDVCVFRTGNSPLVHQCAAHNSQ
jgi:hypothetical protein